MYVADYFSCATLLLQLFRPLYFSPGSENKKKRSNCALGFGVKRNDQHTEGGIIEARVSHRKSSQQHTQAGPKKYTKIANELKNNTHRGRREAPPPVGRRRRRPIGFQLICHFCVFFGPSLCMLLTIFPVRHSCFNYSVLCSGPYRHSG